MTDIRTPDDEVTTPGYFYPPFRQGWWYEGATYAGHSDFAVDFNRRTEDGGWVNDLGDPVLAPAAGTVATVDKAEGLVLLDHPGGYRTEYRHMQDIAVKPGAKVQRSDRIGSIGSVGNSTSPHLHHRHWKRPGPGKPYEAVRMRFEDKPVATSIGDSDSQGPAWSPPSPVMVQGPPERATWEDAYRQANRQRVKAEASSAACLVAKSATEAELRDEKASSLLLRQSLETCQTAEAAFRAQLDACEAKLAECEARPVPDCGTLEAERDAALAIVDAVRRAVGGPL